MARKKLETLTEQMYYVLLSLYALLGRFEEEGCIARYQRMERSRHFADLDLRGFEAVRARVLS